MAACHRNLGAGTSAENRGRAPAALCRDDTRQGRASPRRAAAFLHHGQSAQGDRHVYAARTRFIPDRLLNLFEKNQLAAVGNRDRGPRASQGVRLDVGARMRGMWRERETVTRAG